MAEEEQVDYLLWLAVARAPAPETAAAPSRTRRMTDTVLVVSSEPALV